MRLLFWLYTWWLYVQFSPKKRRCYLFKEALKWLVLFLEVVRFYNINHFLFSNIFSSGFCFGSTHCDFTCNFHLKKRRCYLFMEALKWLFSFLEVVRFYNINHFLCSKIFSCGFGFGSTHGDVTRNYHLKNENLKTWIIHE